MMSSALNFGGAATAVAHDRAARHARYLDFILPHLGPALRAIPLVLLSRCLAAMMLRIVITIRNKSSFFFATDVDRLRGGDIAGYLLAYRTVKGYVCGARWRLLRAVCAVRTFNHTKHTGFCANVQLTIAG